MKLLDTVKKSRIYSAIKEVAGDSMFEIGSTPMRRSNLSIKSKNINN